MYGCGSVLHSDQLRDAIELGNISFAVMCADGVHQALPEPDLGFPF
jgi:hypothetical protein